MAGGTGLCLCFDSLTADFFGDEGPVSSSIGMPSSLKRVRVQVWVAIKANKPHGGAPTEKAEVVHAGKMHGLHGHGSRAPAELLRKAVRRASDQRCRAPPDRAFPPGSQAAGSSIGGRCGGRGRWAGGQSGDGRED